MKVGSPDGRWFPSLNPLSTFLRAGDTANVFIESRSGRLLSVRLGTSVFPARAHGDVAAGRWYQVRITKVGRIATLRVLEPQNSSVEPGALSRSHGLPEPEAQIVVRAFIRSGLPLNSERLALAWRRVRSTSRASVSERARLAAILEEKGLLDSVSLWDRALEAVCGRFDTGGRHHRDGNDEREPQSHDDLADEITRVLRGREEADDPLQLINHLRGRDHHWVIVPLEFEGAVDFSASLRIRLDSSNPTPTATEGFSAAILDVRAQSQRWTFGLVAQEDGLRTVVLGVPQDAVNNQADAASEDRFRPLQARLEELGIPLHLRLMSKDSNDGFSTDEERAILQQVDSSV